MFKAIKKWFIDYFETPKTIEWAQYQLILKLWEEEKDFHKQQREYNAVLRTLVLTREDELKAANAELAEWRSRPEAEMVRKSSEAEIAALHAKTIASEALLTERKLYSAIIRKLLRLCTTADVIMRRKRAKKGVTIEAATEWMTEFENVRTIYMQDINKLDP